MGYQWVRYGWQWQWELLLTMNKSKTAAIVNWTKYIRWQSKNKSKNNINKLDTLLLFSYTFMRVAQRMNENKWINACTLFIIWAIAHIDNVARNIKKWNYQFTSHARIRFHLIAQTMNEERRERESKKKNRRKQISFAKVVGKKLYIFHFISNKK